MRLFRFCLPAFAWLLTATCLSAQSLPAARSSALRSFYESGVHRNGIVGSSLFLLHDNQVVFHDYYGLQRLSPPQPVDETTTYHWASITKTFTGVAILQLRDRGLLSLDDPLIKYIPELAAVHDPYGPVSAITIGQAMSHSSGFRDPTWPWRDAPWQPFEPTQWSQIVAMLPYTSIAFPPGSRYSYSNLAVVFLGEIIQRVSGDPYEAYMIKNILEPLGMYHSYFDRSPYTLLRYRSHSFDLKNGKLTENPFNFNTGITRSNGGLNAPMSDMLKYLNFLLGDPAHQAEYDAILKHSTLEEMWKPLLPIPPDSDFPPRAGADDFVASSFFVHTDGTLHLVGKSGSQNGFLSNFYIDPVSRSAYIVAYNTDAQDATQNTLHFDGQLLNYLIDNFFKDQAGTSTKN
ncbi:MAG TPA: serine hydrolase domain-containing protein [Acidobacteriaceae bacterium]|jgi:CubicO group peptidase (beta-lactamase class C family)|nr:serine hydrolase domain-containing protein [Acidobacteriaceae bacterium]